MSLGKADWVITVVPSSFHEASPESETVNVNVWNPLPASGTATGVGFTAERIRNVSPLGVAACHSAAAIDAPVWSRIAKPPLPSPEPVDEILTETVIGRLLKEAEVVVPTKAGSSVVVMRSAASPPELSIWMLVPDPVENGALHEVPGNAPLKSSLKRTWALPPPLPSSPPPPPQAGIARAARARRNDCLPHRTIHSSFRTCPANGLSRSDPVSYCQFMLM